MSQERSFKVSTAEAPDAPFGTAQGIGLQFPLPNPLQQRPRLDLQIPRCIYYRQPVECHLRRFLKIGHIATLSLIQENCDSLSSDRAA
jgi:hypothetical protein